MATSSLYVGASSGSLSVSLSNNTLFHGYQDPSGIPTPAAILFTNVTADYSGSSVSITANLGTGGETYTFGTGTYVAGKGTRIDATVSPIVTYTDYYYNIANLIGSSLDDSLTGDTSANSLTGDDGNDLLDGGAGADVLIGGDGDDTYVIDNSSDQITETGNDTADVVSASVSWTLAANIESLVLFGVGSIAGTGNTDAENITGNDQNNVLSGSATNDNKVDTLSGGAGNDTYVIYTANSDTVSELAGQGTADTIQADGSYTLTTANVENLSFAAAAAAVNGKGNSLNNFITGSSKNDTLDGDSGTDTLFGGLDNDTYIVDSTTDTISENANAGTDTISSSVNYTLAAGNIENLTLTDQAITAIGNQLANSITGNDQGNVLNGNSGIDTLSGGLGDDIYIVDSTTDTLIEGVNKGTDTVSSSVDFSLASPKLVDTATPPVAAANIENLVLTGSTAISATGNSAVNRITGNANDNIIDGGTTSGANAADDAVADVLIGKGGNDTYVVGAGDVVSENAGEGTADTIQSGASYTMAAASANVEKLSLTSTAAIGNAALVSTGVMITADNSAGTDNQLIGGSGNDTLDAKAKGNGAGGAGSVEQTDVTFVGPATSAGSIVFDGVTINFANADTAATIATNVAKGVYPNYFVSVNVAVVTFTNKVAGNVTDMAPGSFTITSANAHGVSVNPITVTAQGTAVTTEGLYGGSGDDIYIIETTTLDSINEIYNGGGTDTVKSDQSINLSNIAVAGSPPGFYVNSAIENLILTGTAVSGTGNSAINKITGNDSNNVLTASANSATVNAGDVLIGGLGDDSYVVVSSSDVVSELAGGGTDTVSSSVDYTLTAPNIEKFTLTSTATNANAATINSGVVISAENNAGIANILTGGGGADTLNAGDVAVADLSETATLTITGTPVVGATYIYDGTTYTVKPTDTTSTILATSIAATAVTNYTLAASGNVVTFTAKAAGPKTDLTISGTGAAVTQNPLSVATAVTTQGAAAATELSTVTFTGTPVAGKTLIIDGVTITVGSETTASALASSVVSAYTSSSNIKQYTAAIDPANSTAVKFTAVSANTNLTDLTVTGTAIYTGAAVNVTVQGVLKGALDSMYGGAGNDIYVVDSTTDVISDAAGVDTVNSSVDYNLNAVSASVSGIENITLGGSATSATGNASANLINGNTNNNVLDGGAGTDTLVGGDGDDTYITDTADIVSENASGGNDTVQTSVNYTLAAANIENLILSVTSGALGLVGVGSADNNSIIGSSNADTIDGGIGTDTLMGGTGNDTYIVDAVDLVDDTGGDSADLINSSVNFTLAGNVSGIENLTLTGSTAITAVGNSDANIITGNSASNVLDGGSGADTLIGGSGNDTYLIDSSSDVISETGSDTADAVNASVDYTLAATGIENLTLTGTSAITAIGSSSANLITGNSLANVLGGGGGKDTLVGGDGNDTYLIINSTDTITITEVATGGNDTVISNVSYTLTAANIENLTLSVTSGATGLVGVGNAAANIITGSSNADTLNGGSGIDTLVGGGGDDVYIVDSTTDKISDVGNDPNDTISSSVNFSLGTNVVGVENLTLTGSVAISATGNSLENVITGNALANVLSDGGNAATAADTLSGGLGNDTYVITSTLDVISEASSAGADWVSLGVSVDYTLPENVEYLKLISTTGASLTGNSLNNSIIGGSGDDVLDGQSGTDTLSGGDGDDTYIISDSSDVISELASGGNDTAQASVSYTLALANVENLALGDVSTALTAVGNASNNTITGNSSDNLLDGAAGTDVLIGGAGDDTYKVDNSSDVVSELADEGNDTVNASVSYTLNLANVENLSLTATGSTGLFGTGNSNDNVITGSSNADTITGGGGTDTLVGGFGNDTYIVDSTTDIISEGASTNAGTADTVSTTVNYTLATDGNVENITLVGSSALTATGNSLNNVIQGNSFNNVIDGGEGADTLIGGYGVSTANGIETDIDGADIYIVDNTADVISESGKNTYAVDPATDLISAVNPDIVSSSVSYTLKSNLENLVLASGTAALNGTGNNQANVLTGNDGNNVLDGKGGNDVMIGGKGDDTYVSDSSADIVSENASEGNDTVQVNVSYTLDLANIENLTLIGTNSIDGTGNTENNVITGNTANNVLDGGDGTDTLIGGAGNDDYVIDSTTDVISEAASAGDDYVSSSVNYTLTANVEILDLVNGASAALSGTGNSGDNTLLGNEFNNVLTGGAGTDTLVGGAGNDTYIVDSTTDLISEVAGEGSADVVNASVNYTLTAANVENVTLTGTAVSAKGSSIANIITGTNANNVLDGGAGNDTLIGGAGNDAYIVDSTTDVISDTAGTDTVSSSVTFNIYGSAQGLTLENVTLTGSNAINAGGNSLANVLTGNSAANVLDGGAGADTLIGGLGNDTYGVDSTADVVSEAASAGTDVIRSSINYTLSAVNVENLSLYVASGTVGLAGTGSSSNNIINGSSNADTLDGGAGTDTLNGGAGNDTYVIDSSTDTINEATGAGTDTIRSSVNYSLVGNVENLVLIGTSALNATGNGLNNNITGNSLNNVIDGGSGVDTLAGGAGNDVYIVDNSADIVNEISSGTAGGTDTISSSVNYSLAAVITNGVTLAPANIENLVLTGSAVTGLGNSLANQVTGNSANNVLNGGAGADTLIGGSGDDIYVIDSTADIISELASGGIDTVSSSIGYVLPNPTSGATVENLTLTGSVIYGGGNSLDNVITGNSANNLLNGGVGADTLIGGLGNDTYVIDQTGDVISEATGAGSDTVQVSTNYTLSLANIENLTLSGSSAITAVGDAGNNVITGSGAANVIEGGLGVDTLMGGAGSDTYVVDTSTDVISETLSLSAGGGSDTVVSSVNYSLTAVNVENVTLNGSTATVAAGNSGDNTLTGNTLANTLSGGDGNDVYIVDAADTVVELNNSNGGSDTIVSSVSYTLNVANVENVRLSGSANLDATGTSGNNALIGNDGNNVLTALDGNDRLNGGSGVDTLIGGAGNDVYVVDTTTDTISETATGGTDTIRASINYTLNIANVENLALDGTGSTVGHVATGNSLANVITASVGTNVADTLVGGDGNDIYIVDSSTDVISEASGQGTDSVQSSVNYALTADNVENVTLTGSTATNASGNDNANTITGNSLANNLTGNGGNDVLTGGSGLDTLAGGAGDDLYILYTTSDLTDQINEASGNGTDTIGSYLNYTLNQANVETLSLLGTLAVSATGNSANNLLTGNNIDNVLIGGDGKDTLDGGLGSDTLTGGNGGDMFKLVGVDANKFDTINDFTTGDDTIGLLKTGFGDLGADNLITSAELGFGSTATTAAQRLIYNSADGALYFDADGNATTAQPQQIALIGVSTHPATLSPTDFSLIQPDGIV
jgi:Ca2+-binding RTX toxin-like protein